MIWGDTYTYAKHDLEHYCRSKVNAEQKNFNGVKLHYALTLYVLHEDYKSVVSIFMISVVWKLLIDWARRYWWMKYDHVCTNAIQQIAQFMAGVTFTMYKIDILNHRI